MYSAEINRRQPALLLLLIDQSYSMSEPWAQEEGSKADALAAGVNDLLGNAVLLCSKGNDRIYSYFEIGIIGYGTGVAPALHGTSDTRPILPIDEVARNPRRVDSVIRYVPDLLGEEQPESQYTPIWVDPVTDGATSMRAAFAEAEVLTREWCYAHRNSFPPLIINVTDGASTDGDPSDIGKRIRDLGTDDGNALLFNVHLSSLAAEQVTFPSTDAALLDPNAHMLFEMSSPMPPSMLEAAAALHYAVQTDSRGFLYNADATVVIDFLNIGTRAVTPTGLKELTAAAAGSPDLPTSR
ncbi:hypothetical protein ACWDOP_33130 [Nocardia sp. NPDC003693]